MKDCDLKKLKAVVDDLVSAIKLSKATIEQQQRTIFSLEEKNASLVLNALGTIVDDYVQRKELAAQRRTIATLRARLAYKSQGYQEDVCFLGDRFNQYRRVGNEFRKHDLHGLHEIRIAAIRNFGALP